MTAEEFKDLEKKLLKEKVKEILTKKLEKKEKDSELSCGEKKEIKEHVELNSNQPSEPVKEIVELNIKSEESKSGDKYSSTFESEDDIGTDTKSGKSVKSDSEEEEKSLPVPSEKSKDSSESAEIDEEKVEVRETPPPAETDYHQKMLSTIEEVTTVADTEDNEEDYSDNFVSSDISSHPEVQYSSPTSDSAAASKDVTELEDSQERETEAGEQDLTEEDKHNQQPALAMEAGQDQQSREEGLGHDPPRKKEEEGEGGYHHHIEEDQEDQPSGDHTRDDEQDQQTDSLSKEWSCELLFIKNSF